MTTALTISTSTDQSKWSKTIMDDKEYGIVVFFNEDGGYGFARRDNGERDIFFHISAISRGEEPRIGDRVSFEIGSDKNHRPCATNMRVVANAVQSSLPSHLGY